MERADGQVTPLATQGVQVYFHFLPTTEHANGRKETSRWHNSILLPNDLAIPREEDLEWRWGELVRMGLAPPWGVEKRVRSGPFSGDTRVIQT